jgi:glyoxylase-like metal-dependent hydrolase (beta-lactamase superfamily II)
VPWPIVGALGEADLLRRPRLDAVSGSRILALWRPHLAVAASRDAGAPSLIIDAGTGLRRVSGLLGDASFRGTVLLSHLHWDHVHGLPFFAAGARPAHRGQWCFRPGDDPVATLACGLSPPHFPVGPASSARGGPSTGSPRA